jgi:tRNA dimethylallyltransferase
MQSNARAAREEDAAALRLLIGPTASGKSALALELARCAGAEIVSLDSMLVYRGMDIGTAKPSASEREQVRHHLLDRVDPNERYDVRCYLADTAAVLDDLGQRGVRALFVGGTGLYVQSLLYGLFDAPPVDLRLRAELEAQVRAHGLAALHARLCEIDPASAARIHPNDEKRLVRALEVHAQTGKPLSEWQVTWGSEGRGPLARAHRMVGLAIAGERLAQRITERTRAMLDAGWAEEACRVRDTTGFGPTAGQALGYREAMAWAAGQVSRAEAEQAIARATRRFARRQATWFRRFPGVTWIPWDAPDRVQRALDALGWR